MSTPNRLYMNMNSILRPAQPANAAWWASFAIASDRQRTRMPMLATHRKREREYAEEDATYRRQWLDWESEEDAAYDKTEVQP